MRAAFAAGIFRALVAWTVPAEAAAEPPQTVIFNIGTTIVSLDAQYIDPPPEPGTVQTVRPAPFNCVNIKDYEGTEWFAQRGQTSQSEWRTFRCTHYDRKITLNVRGTGRYDEVGFAHMSFDFKLAFWPDASTGWPECAKRKENGPSDPGEVVRWDQLDTTLVGRCGNWQITAKVTMLEGFAPFEP